MKLKTKDDVYNLLYSAAPSAALAAAIETELLWQLAEKPMNAKEVAQALNISKGAVKTRLYRARKMFRGAYEGEGIL